MQEAVLPRFEQKKPVFFTPLQDILRAKAQQVSARGKEILQATKGKSSEGGGALAQTLRHLFVSQREINELTAFRTKYSHNPRPQDKEYDIWRRVNAAETLAYYFYEAADWVPHLDKIPSAIGGKRTVPILAVASTGALIAACGELPPQVQNARETIQVMSTTGDARIYASATQMAKNVDKTVKTITAAEQTVDARQAGTATAQAKIDATRAPTVAAQQTTQAKYDQTRVAALQTRDAHVVETLQALPNQVDKIGGDLQRILDDLKSGKIKPDNAQMKQEFNNNIAKLMVIAQDTTKPISERRKALDALRAPYNGGIASVWMEGYACKAVGGVITYVTRGDGQECRSLISFVDEQENILKYGK